MPKWVIWPFCATPDSMTGPGQGCGQGAELGSASLLHAGELVLVLLGLIWR